MYKISRYYANRYGIVFVEGLDVKNMLEGKSLSKDNNTLYRNIANKAFNRFIQLLYYKTKIIRIDPRNTTKECYRCGSIQNMDLEDIEYLNAVNVV